MERAYRWAILRETAVLGVAMIAIVYMLTHGLGCTSIPVPGSP